MKKAIIVILSLLLSILCVHGQDGGADVYPADYASAPRFKALFVMDPGAEEAHVQFDRQALEFYHKLSYGEGFIMDIVEDMDRFPDSYEGLMDYDVIVMLNAAPNTGKQRDAFEEYMKKGGGWLGFHASAYNDSNTGWDWYNEFLGCGAFYCNNWPPQPALVVCDDQENPVTATLPKEFVIPASEFYQWSPSPRLDKDVKVLMSISPKMYPFGIKDIVRFGDFPIVWTNTRYRMLYINQGHGDECFIDASQNLLFTNALRWLVKDKLDK